jgi:uncharacterized protein (TIRG00374 family)
MEVDSKKIFQTLNLRKVWIPLLVGLLVVVYLLGTDPDMTLEHLSLFKEANWRYVVTSILLVACRDIGYMYRLRLITNYSISWLACAYVIALWEFSSAVTPSVAGGSLVAVYLLFKEGIPLSKSFAYIMVTAIFDNLFFILFSPLGFLSARAHLGVAATWSTGIDLLFWLGYGITFLYTGLSIFALFVKPSFFKWLLVKITNIRFLRRWQQQAIRQGDDMIMASAVLKEEKNHYWIKVMLVTTFVWAARYGILNTLIAAYVPVDTLQNILIFGKQVVMWVIMLLSPTPGSSGTAEYFFKQFYADLLGKYVLIVALLWRLITYYFYLLLGVLVLPRWLKRTFVAEERVAPENEA